MDLHTRPASPEALSLPVDHESFVSLSVPEAVTSLSLKIGVTPQAVFAAAFGTLLHRYSDDSTVSIEHVGSRNEIPGPGWLLRLDFEERSTFESIALQAENQLHVQARKTASAADVAAVLSTDAQSGTAAVRWFSSPKALQDAPPELINARIEAILGAALGSMTLPVANIPLITEQERDLQREWNDTAAPYERDLSLVNAILRHCETAPGDIAVACDEKRLTYGQLGRMSAQLACRLRERAVGPGEFVAIYLERSVEMYVAILGIQRAGAAYVPIDPDYPAERVEFMLRNCRASVVVTQSSLRRRVSTMPIVTLSLDDDTETIFAGDERPADLPSDPHRLAYAIYTSGSTGQPKGVLIEQHSVQNLLADLTSRVAIGAGDTLLALAPLAFDMSVVDVYLPLTTGARIVVASRETAKNPRALMALMDASRVTHMQATPSTWRTLIESGWQGTRGLHVLTGGEALPQSVADLLVERSPIVWNLYGPTEATVWATMHRVTRRLEPVTIGKPMKNVTTYILDGQHQQLPVGIVGELFIGGAGVARGYLDRPELTTERFVPDPFHPDPSARMYATGDLARYRDDGNIEFLGRSDFQVKLRGYRIELGEVETALAAQPGVSAAVATVREDVPGDPRLIAYVAIGEHGDIAAGSIRRALLEKLPSYMVPDAVVVLDALPLSANGKIDRKALPPPAATVSNGTARVAPRSTTEERLLAIWEDVLDVHPIGVTDDFFDIGATSITAARVFDRIEREMGASLPLSPLFQAPTIELLAKLIDEGSDDKRWTSLVPIQPLGTQIPIFCVHGGSGAVLHFRPLARRLGFDQPFYGLQMQGLYGDAPVHLTVEAMAAHYLEEIKAVQPRGPYIIAGYCFGALVAFDIVRRLEIAGEEVKLLFTINGPTPAYIRTHGGPSKTAPIVRQATVWDRSFGRIWKRLQWERAEGIKLRILDWRIRRRAAMSSPLPDAWRREAIYHICMKAEVRYAPERVSSPAIAFTSPDLYRVDDLGWSQHFAGSFDVRGVPGEHRNQRSAMAEPAVAYIAEELKKVLGYTPAVKS